MAESSLTGPRPTTAVSPEVVGRAAELGGLRAALDAARRGQGGVVFLAGEAGIGKSRLLDVVAGDAARAGVPVLRGRAVQTSTPAAFRPLAEALSSAVRAGISPDPADLAPFCAPLGRLLPAWRVDQPSRLDESLLAVAEGVLGFLTATAGDRGALVVLEDLQWADPESLGIVEYLTDNLTAQRLLCLVSVRDDERSPGLALARALHTRRAGRLLTVPPLPDREVAAMVASCLGATSVPVDVAAMAARAEGVPFAVEELLATALASGALAFEGGIWRTTTDAGAVVPLTVSEGMRDRITRLGAEVRDVLVAAAVLGRRFPWSLLPAVTGLDEDSVLAALHDAVDAQLVSVDRVGEGFRFRHALTRDAVLAELFPPELAGLSRRAVEAVERAHPDLEDDWCGLAADLLLAAGDRTRAAALLVETARRAFRRGALATAESALDRAGGLLPDGDATRHDVDELLLQVLALAGKRERAVDVAASLLRRLGTSSGSARRRAVVHLRLARAAVAATRWAEADEQLAQARLETTASDVDLVAELDAVLAQTVVIGDPTRAAELARAALATADRLGLPEVACEALEVLGRSQRAHDLTAAESAFTRALRLAESRGLTLSRARALHELGAIDMLRGRGVARLERARELAVDQGALATAAVVDVQIAAALVIGDDPETGAVAARRSAELARRHHLDQTLAAAVALEAYVHARSRRRAEMRRCIDEASTIGLGHPDVEVKTSTAAALLELVEEDRAAARRRLCTGLLASARAGSDCSAVPAIGLLALLRQVDGPDDEAEEVRTPERSVHFLASAFLRYADAVAAGRAGHTRLAAAAVAEADRTLGDHRWFRHLGTRLVAEVSVGEGWGDPVPSLRASLDFFDRRGEDHLASACRSMLRKAGAPVPRRRGDADVPGHLRALGVTGRELEVLTLLGQGLPNADIASRLFLSTRTVERHVANLVGKTGIARRSLLVAYAARMTRAGAPSS